MRIPRIYSDDPRYFSPGDEIFLSEKAARHAGVVLRRRNHDQLVIFNHTSSEDYVCEIIEKKQQKIKLKILYAVNSLPKPRLYVHLMQAICRSEKMDWLIQKATELGVSAITPLVTAYTQGFRAKKNLRWEHIILSSCEQCGRNDIPTLHPCRALDDILKTWPPEEKVTGFFLHPDSAFTLASFFSRLSRQDLACEKIYLFIGPEGGFSTDELLQAKQKGLPVVKLGPRILRAETAVLAAVAALHAWGGDFT